MTMVERMWERQKALYRAILEALDRPLTPDEVKWLAWYKKQKSSDAALSEGRE
ncbi:hypothetical protein GCM10007276_11950 [Agaricicola taiwanensis]|uniref:Uncharacterized protein n=1 Tax=Agaricicola taiwanensis TaxID=591372 RepID=A0A8J2YC92_9RHOB|nr:hypothetical protein GCM10007276_11950 [Agaricicola taiwanensis]